MASAPPRLQDQASMAAVGGAVDEVRFCSDVVFLFDSKGVPESMRAKVKETGLNTVSRFALLAETRAELKEIVQQEWGMIIGAPGVRLAVATLIEAWQAAKSTELAGLPGAWLHP